MAALKIGVVSTARDLREFIDLAYRLNAADPAWVPPLRIDIRARLSREKNPFFEHGEADYFLGALAPAGGPPGRSSTTDPSRLEATPRVLRNESLSVGVLDPGVTALSQSRRPGHRGTAEQDVVGREGAVRSLPERRRRVRKLLAQAAQRGLTIGPCIEVSGQHGRDRGRADIVFGARPGGL